MALTFDDGPHPDGTPAVLEALGDATATFFMVGEQVERYPSLAAEVAGAGHEIALHGYPSHLHINLLPCLRGRGFGRRLMDQWLRTIGEMGSRGAHGQGLGCRQSDLLHERRRGRPKLIGRSEAMSFAPRGGLIGET